MTPNLNQMKLRDSLMVFVHLFTDGGRRLFLFNLRTIFPWKWTSKQPFGFHRMSSFRYLLWVWWHAPTTFQFLPLTERQKARAGDVPTDINRKDNRRTTSRSTVGSGDEATFHRSIRHNIDKRGTLGLFWILNLCFSRF